MQALRNLLLTVPYKKNYQIRKKKKKKNLEGMNRIKNQEYAKKLLKDADKSK